MHIQRAASRLRVALAFTAAVWALAGGLAAAPAHAQPDDPPELRALWVLRTSLTTPASIESLVRTARDRGFNAIFVQVRGRGDAYYASTLEPRALDLARQPASFDPLQVVIDRAHAAGLRVHAWMNVNLVASATDLPVARTHVIYAHPDWLMVPRPIAQDVASIDPTDPAYLGKIARWTRGASDTVEGLYTSPLIPAAAAYVARVVADVARRYAVDGIHLDYARYPTDQFDYSRGAIAQFRAELRPTLPAAVQRTLDAREAVDLFAYPDQYPQQWAAFRRTRMTGLMMRLRTAIKTARPSALVSVAVAPDVQGAYDHRLQDWRTWLENGLVDAVCPMAYTTDPAEFSDQIRSAGEIAGPRMVWAGIGAYRLTAAQTVDNIQTIRRLGAAGFILFSYDSLTAAARGDSDYLAFVGRAITSAGPPDPNAR
ncbi:MAG TPA: family 10 glycosylhydrolase [Vicinamibacterales bacterium]|nr:family 10 glycosylhydrolase [Vicinamibacterales bacterium]